MKDGAKRILRGLMKVLLLIFFGIILTVYLQSLFIDPGVRLFAWRSFSANIQSDPRMWVYYDFEYSNQHACIPNRAMGDPMRLVVSDTQASPLYGEALDLFLTELKGEGTRELDTGMYWDVGSVKGKGALYFHNSWAEMTNQLYQQRASSFTLFLTFKRMTGEKSGTLMSAGKGQRTLWQLKFDVANNRTRFTFDSAINGQSNAHITEVLSSEKYYSLAMSFDADQDVVIWYLNGRVLYRDRMDLNELILVDQNAPLILGSGFKGVYSEAYSKDRPDYFNGMIQQAGIALDILSSGEIKRIARINQCE